MRNKEKHGGETMRRIMEKQQGEAGRTQKEDKEGGETRR